MCTSPEIVKMQAGRALRRTVFTEDQIQARVRELAQEITKAHSGEEGLLMLGLLKGSFIFMADLVRHIHRPLEVDFLVASSYGNDTVSSGEVRLLYDPEASLEGRSVILIEDIVDSGTTLNTLIPLLEARGPRSLEVCALLHKRVGKLHRNLRWVGFDAPQEFLVGYGLDYGENFRHLPFIGSI